MPALWGSPRPRSAGRAARRCMRARRRRLDLRPRLGLRLDLRLRRWRRREIATSSISARVRAARGGAPPARP
eukprot:scaffold57080_cov63-Phaeocystis_antarctica.AAC.8